MRRMKRSPIVRFSLRLALLGALLLTAACGIFNLGGTNEDGTPKPTAEWARTVLRGATDAWLQVYGPDVLAKIPALLLIVDTNHDGIPTLEELETAIDLSDPTALTNTLFAAFLELKRLQDAHPPAATTAGG